MGSIGHFTGKRSLSLTNTVRVDPLQLIQCVHVCSVPRILSESGEFMRMFEAGGPSHLTRGCLARVDLTRIHDPVGGTNARTVGQTSIISPRLVRSMKTSFK